MFSVISINRIYNEVKHKMSFICKFVNRFLEDFRDFLKNTYSNETNVKIFNDLQKLESVGLVVPDGHEHMYYAVMESKACKLTAIGQHYWRLVKENII